MYDDLDAVEGDVVEEMRLDDLQPLVDECGAVHRDHRAHGPRGVGESVLGSDMCQLGTRTATERPAGGRHHQLAYVGPRPRGQRLEEGGVLGVDRNDLAGLGEGLDQRPADDERLLVGEGERPAGLEGGEGGRESDGSGDAVEHGVAGGGGELGGGTGSCQDLGQGRGSVLLRECLAKRRHRVLAGHRDRVDAQLPCLLGEECDAAAGGGESGDTEAVGVAQYQVDGLRADGPGGAEDDDVPAAFGRVEDEVRVGEGDGLSLIPPLWPLPLSGRTVRP